jgi:hypothetical protein
MRCQDEPFPLITPLLARYKAPQWIDAYLVDETLDLPADDITDLVLDP